MSGYLPISCDMHSELELLTMRRTRCCLQLLDADVTVNGIIANFIIRDKAEYLLMESGEMIRLDRIIGVTPLQEASVQCK